LKLKGDRDILKMYTHTENEADSLKHSKLGTWIEKIWKYISSSKANVKMSKAPNYLERYRNRYSDQAPAISGQ